MSAIDEIGLSKDMFHKLYTSNHGFSGRYNANHPLREEEETAYSFVRKGAEKLIAENMDIVNAITEAGTYHVDC